MRPAADPVRVGDLRYARFAERLRQSNDRASAIRESSDEELVQALAAVSLEPGLRDAYLANVLASELLNRARRKSVIIDTAEEGMLAIDPDGVVTFANRAAERMLGRPAADLAGRHLDATFHAHDGGEGPCRLLAAGEGLHEDSFATSDGTRFPVSISVAHVVRDGEVQGFVLVFRDATERKLEESLRAVRLEIRETIASARSVEEAAPRLLAVIGDGFGWDAGAFWTERRAGELACLAFWSRDPLGVPAFRATTQGIVLRAGEGVPGRVWASGEVAVVPDLSALPSDAFPRADAARRDGLKAAVAFPCSAERKTLAVLEFYATRARPPDERFLGAVESVGSEVGQLIVRRRAEALLRESEMRKAGILEAALDAVITIDALGRVVECNAAAERMFGYPREELLGSELSATIVPERFRDAHRAGIRRFVEAGEGPILGRLLKLPARRKDGVEITTELYIVPVPLGDRTLFTSYLRDVTARREEDARERAETARLRAIAATERDVAEGALDLDATLAAVAARAQEATGAHGATVQLCEGEDLVYRAGTGLFAETVGARLGIDRSLSGLALRSGEVLASADAQSDERVDRAAAQRLGVRSFVVVPMRHRGGVLGALKVASRDPRAFGAPEVLTLEVLAALLASAVRPAQPGPARAGGSDAGPRA